MYNLCTGYYVRETGSKHDYLIMKEILLTSKYGVLMMVMLQPTNMFLKRQVNEEGWITEL